MNRNDRSERLTLIRTLTRPGFTAQEIAVRLCVTQRTVCRYRAKAGVYEVGPNTPITEDELLKAKELLEDGASYQEVSRTLGRTSGAICRKFPGYSWTKRQAVNYRAMVGAFNQLPDRLAPCPAALKTCAGLDL